jgi:hypothetical protein
MPTWPVDTHTRRLFTANNAVLVMPLVLDFTDLKPAWLKELTGIAAHAFGAK